MPDFSDVATYLAGFGLEARAFDRPTPTAPAAAEVVGCHVAQIAKTMLVTIGGDPLVVVASGDARLHAPLLKAVVGRGGKVRFCPSEQVMDLLGYPPGGVCPFLLPRELPVLLDVSMQRFERIYPAAGTPASAADIPVAMLEQVCAGRWARVCQVPNGEG